jgi:hypothetical protein
MQFVKRFEQAFALLASAYMASGGETKLALILFAATCLIEAI